ncbi:MAG: hypothetical protein KA777_01285 [Rhodoferax sp.]|nr:hypothetical protein [Rhodoferax sp.]
MSTRHKRRYRPRPVTADTMALALHFAAKPSQADRQEVLGVLQQAHKALREGVATQMHWSILSGALETAQAIERKGVVRGLGGHLEAAQIALHTIWRRSAVNGAWRSPTLHYQELDAIGTFVELHTFQIHQLGRAELLAAMDAAARRIKAGGGDVCVLDQQQYQQQVAA